MCTKSMPGAWGHQKRAMDTLEMKLWMSVRPQVGAGNQTQVSAGLIHALNCWAISPQSKFLLCFKSLKKQSMFISVLLVYVCLHHIHCWCSQRPQEGNGSPGTRVMDGCKTGQIILAPLKEQQIFCCYLDTGSYYVVLAGPKLFM